MSPAIHFWIVNNSAEKCKCVCDLVYKHFSQGQRVLILAPNQQACDYINQMLWRMSPDEFLPHAVAADPIQAAVIITSHAVNLNQAQVLVNLCPQACPIVDQFSQVHELHDKSDPAKERAALERKQTYASKDYQVIEERE